jgi:hypothetical protein
MFESDPDPRRLVAQRPDQATDNDALSVVGGRDAKLRSMFFNGIELGIGSE